MDRAAAADEDDSAPAPKRASALFIDLNEIPSPACDTPSPATLPAAPSPEDAYAMVCRIHGRLAGADRPAAEFPGEAGVGLLYPCALCGLPEKRGETMVCDGCERGFHVSCARYWPRQRPETEDWLCDECSGNGVPKKRWALGAVKLLDMNASPPSDGDVEEQLGGRIAGGHCRIAETALIGSNAKDSTANIGCPMNAFALVNSTCMAGKVNSSEVTLHHGVHPKSGCEDLHSVNYIRHRYPGNSVTVSGRSQGDIFLCSLRDFIAEKGGCLSEGWHVEFKQSTNRTDSYAVYFSPDGRRFESVFDVARYLGVASTVQSIEVDETGDGFEVLQRSLASRQRKRKFSRISNSSSENLDGIRNNFSGEHSSDAEILEPQFSDVRSGSRITNAFSDENCGSNSQCLSVPLPVQYEDFFVSSFGKIDSRMAYHSRSKIFPVGYKSIWHDKITGSVFECEVFDGGDSGPIFRVKRGPCSLSPIPVGETSILHNMVKRTEIEETTAGNIFPNDDCDMDDDILTLVCDHSPAYNDFFSLFSGDDVELPYACSNHVDTPVSSASNSSCDGCHVKRFGAHSNNNSSLMDSIGEFYVEGRSSSSVWKMVSETLVNACHEVFRRCGHVLFSCKHDSKSFPSMLNDIVAKPIHCHDLLANFSITSGPLNTPRFINNTNELDSSCKSLSEWLEKDRFGLDIDFVQEILETLPGSYACSRYHFLKDREDSIIPWTIGSGRLVAVQKNEEMVDVVAPDSLQKGTVQPELESQLCRRWLPYGRSLSNKLPRDLVGDVYQIWDFLCRFHEILGLKETLNFDELEEELVDPWPCIPYNLSSSEKNNHVSREGNSQLNGSVNGSIFTCESVERLDRDNILTFVTIETAAAREAAQAKLAERSYGRCTGLALTKIHSSLLKVLVGELLNKVAVYVDPNFDTKESKPRRGRKKDVDNSYIKETKLETLTVNEFTWPELARRYVLAVSSMNGCMDSSEACIREGPKVFRCLQGDGGILCGSLSGISGMEADALLLAEAERQISDSTKHDIEVLQVDFKDSEAVGDCEPTVGAASSLPEWAQPLEPVRKLPTNVGTRIRRCIFNALEKDPPEWAKEILQHSISKEVYKGNASGPTKKAVLSVLARATAGSVAQKPNKRQKDKSPISVLEAIMKKCRIVLRSAVSADESKVFCNLIGTSLLNTNDNEDEGILGSPAMVSRALDFRTIDLRLAFGAYGSSHEAFAEDVREVWHNIHLAYKDRPDLLQMAGLLSQNFESLYEKEVLYLVQKVADRYCNEHNAETQKELQDILLGTNELPKAPWEEGVCKVCGIDKDDDSVLLCDCCDSEYHTYCLNPPLARIPEGNWYCPSCVLGQAKMQGINPPSAQVLNSQPRRLLGEDTKAFHEVLCQLLITLEEKEYWELSIDERVFLLKFLCDEVLNSLLIREHLEQCADRSNDLHQKLRALTVEWRNLKFKEEMLAMRTMNDCTNKAMGVVATGKEDAITAMLATHGKLTEQHQHLSNKLHYSSVSGNALKVIPTHFESSLEVSGQSDVHMSQLSKSAHVKHGNGNIDQNCPPSSTCFADDELASKMVVTLSLHQVNQAPEEVIQSIEHKERTPISTDHDSLDARSISSVEKNGSMMSKVDRALGHGLLPDNGRTIFADKTVSMTINDGANMSSQNLLTFNQSATLQGSDMSISFNLFDSDNSDLEMNSLKKEISQLQESIAISESQLMMASLRREFLGRDSLGQLYWIIGRPGKRSWLVIDGSMLLAQERKQDSEMRAVEYRGSQDLDGSIMGMKAPSGSSYEPEHGFSPFFLFESDSELQELVSWLRDNDPKERELKECILMWQRLRFHQENVCTPNESGLTSKNSYICEECVAPSSLNTKAAGILEKKYGPFFDIEVSEAPKKRAKKAKFSFDDKLYRCECLEPVWPSRHHCISCHQTFSILQELERHDEGKCTSSNLASDEGKENDDLIKTKGGCKDKELNDYLDNAEPLKKGNLGVSFNLVNFHRKKCPYDLDQVRKRFITNNSNKDLVREIGLIGTKGIPSLVPGCSTLFFDPTLVLDQNGIYDAAASEGISTQMESARDDLNFCDVGKGDRNTAMVLQNGHAHGQGEYLLKRGWSTSDYIEVQSTSSSVFCKPENSDVTLSCTIPEPSLRPFVGKISQVVKRLKMNLLDMDAALPGEAVRPSKASLVRRCAWRMFVKSAESIFELVQATILFEGMIKTDYLRNGWWYWSSLTAAARTPTVSALALRVYALDDSIIYVKDPSPSLDPEVQRPMSRTGRKRKDLEVGS